MGPFGDVHAPLVPCVQRAQMYMPLLVAAIDRAKLAWNTAQLREALRSAEHQIQQMRKELL